MFSALLLAMWIGIGTEGTPGIPGVSPLESFDFDGTNGCEISLLCGPAKTFGPELVFTEYSRDLSDLGADFNIGNRIFGFTALSNGTLTWNGTALTYAQNGPGPHSLTFTTPSLDNFLFLRTAANALFIAIEDLPGGRLGGSDGDYNDALFEVIPAPEPGTLLLLGSGLAAMARFARRRRVA